MCAYNVASERLAAAKWIARTKATAYTPWRRSP